MSNYHQHTVDNERRQQELRQAVHRHEGWAKRDRQERARQDEIRRDADASAPAFHSAEAARNRMMQRGRG